MVGINGYCYEQLFSDLTFNGKDRDEGFAFFFLLELDDAVTQGVQGVILAHADILAGVVSRTALADDDVAGDALLTAENLNA